MFPIKILNTVAVITAILSFIGCDRVDSNVRPSPSLGIGPVPHYIDSVSIMGSESLRIDVDSNGVDDILISTSFPFGTTWTDIDLKLIALNQSTFIHGRQSSQDLCIDTTVLSDGDTAINVANCSAGLTHFSTILYTEAIRLDSVDLSSVVFLAAPTDTSCLYFSRSSHHITVQYVYLTSYSYGSLNNEGYYIIAVDGQKYAYEFRIQMPYLLVVSKQKL